MFNFPFTRYLKERREELNLTQDQAARLAGISRHRWPKLEQGRSAPTEEDFEALARFFQVPLSKFRNLLRRPPALESELRDAGKRAHPTPSAYFPPRDRPSFVRYRAAKDSFGSVAHAITSRLRDRPDFGRVAYFCEVVSIGSADECLFLLWLLLRGARPALSIPASFGHLSHPVVEPRRRAYVGNRPFPALLLDDATHFFQVSLATPQIYTVDCLYWNSSGRRVIEIDGPGHDGRSDETRTQTLDMPVERLTTSDLLMKCRESLGWVPA